MRVYFHSNLDEPSLVSLTPGIGVGLGDLPAGHIPQIGAWIMIPYYGKLVELEVVGVRYERVKRASTYVAEERVTHEWVAKVELHIPKYFLGTIADWEKRMRAIREGTTQEP